MIINHFKMRSNVISYNLAGMGCSASPIAIDLAQQMLQLNPSTYALVLSTENITQVCVCISTQQNLPSQYAVMPFMVLSVLVFVSKSWGVDGDGTLLDLHGLRLGYFNPAVTERILISRREKRAEERHRSNRTH